MTKLTIAVSLMILLLIIGLLTKTAILIFLAEILAVYVIVNGLMNSFKEQ